MLFSIEVDAGDRVTGYVVPDGFTDSPQLRVCDGGKELLTLAADEPRDGLVAAGRHETGRCGFSIDTVKLPALPQLKHLEIFEAGTGVLVYRRKTPSMIAQKIIRLETHLFPLWRFDDALRPNFQYHARGIEDLGRETVTQLLLLSTIDSVYLSGRILYANYVHFIESSFRTIILLQDPYEELAERLLVLSKINKVGARILGLRDNLALKAAVEFAESFPFTDETLIRKALRQISPEVAAVLANPIVRQLTATTPDEMPRRGAVAAALDVLATFALVEFRRDAGSFVNSLAEFLGLDLSHAPPIQRFSGVERLADILRSDGQADEFLDMDLELHHHVAQSFSRVKRATTADEP
jgi:hypothetical protein